MQYTSKSGCDSEASPCDSDSDDKPVMMKCNERLAANAPTKPLKKRAKSEKSPLPARGGRRAVSVSVSVTVTASGE